MLTAFRGLGAVSVAVLTVLLIGSQASAQTYGWVQGTRYAPSQGYLGESSTSPYYTTYGYTLNGFPPRFYSSFMTQNLPTYLTSINYPTIYGAYGYGYAPGRFTYSAQIADYSTSPNIYGVYAPETNAVMSMRTLPDTAATPLRTTATVNVVLPADAELSFQGIRVGQTGDYRRFITPPLLPGSSYTYDIRATWRANGQEVTRDRHVDIQAGDQLTVDLLTPTPAEQGTATLRARPNR